MLHDEDTFEHRGREFTFRTEHDDSHGAPWEECDGHGSVSEWKRHPFGHGTKPPKAPGERILVWERGSYRTYDFAETIRIAKRDGWGLASKDEAEMAQKLGRAPTHGEICAEAVERDFCFLAGWCNNEWSYIGVIVKHESGACESLWGIESCSGEYLEEVAHELADEISERLNTELAERIQEERPDMLPAA